MAKDEKQISIVIAASGEVKDVAVSPGATVEDIKSETGLKGYQISRKGGEPLSSNADIFAEVADGEKLYATPEDVSVGSGGSAPLSKFISTMRKIINSTAVKFYLYLERFKKRHLLFTKRARLICSRYIRKSDARKIIVVRRESASPRVVRGNKEYAYWQENGWRKIGDEYRGFFQTKYGKWQGIIREKYFGNYTFYIIMPPAVLKSSTHWGCFGYKGNDLYSIHFSHKPKDISSGILTVEQLITQSFKRVRKGGTDVS